MSGSRVIVPILGQDPTGVTRRVFELPGSDCPKERRQTEPTQDQGRRDQDGQNLHDYFSLNAFRETVIDDSDIARAAAKGVAEPIRAKGTATTLYPAEIAKFSIMRRLA